MFKKKKTKEEVIKVLEKATRAWDVAPKGTVDYGVLEKLAEELLNSK